MPTVTKIQYELPDAQFLNRMLTDDLILRYVKDAYDVSEHCLEFYDTKDWALTGGGFSLNLEREDEIPVLRLFSGKLDPEVLPGLFRGEEWAAPFMGVETAVAALLERGAPDRLRRLTSRTLQRNFFMIYSTKSTTLYLPDRTRVLMSFDNGELVAGDRRMPIYNLSMELLFGEERLLVNYCEQICEQFRLQPVNRSRESKALSLMREENRK